MSSGALFDLLEKPALFGEAYGTLDHGAYRLGNETVDIVIVSREYIIDRKLFYPIANSGKNHLTLGEA